MNAKQLERASYMAAHAILASNTSAPELACPGARRSHAVDVIAETIRSVFELHCSALDESTDWYASVATIRRPLGEMREAVETPPQSAPLNQKLHRVVQEVH
jgi:hypothetical protein